MTFWENKSMTWRNFIITVLVILSSTYSVVTAAGDDVFEIETDGGYPMVIGSSNYFAKGMALFIAKKKANESYQEETAQYLSSKIDPGIDLAKARRYIRSSV